MGRIAAALYFSLAALGACSGDDSGPNPRPPAVPASELTPGQVQMEPFVSTRCAELAATPAGQACRVTGGSARLLLRGNVLTPGMVYLGGAVLVEEDGVIACAGCGCEGDAADATRVECPGAAISPGLINPHDHLDFINHHPVPASSERYEHRHDWRTGARGHTEIGVAERATEAELHWGELRFLLGGATATVGLGRTPAPGLLRNLDGDSGLSGLPERVTAPLAPGYPRVYYNVFPLGDASGIQRLGDCDYGSDATALDSADELLLFGYSYLPHVAEGIDAESRNEFRCLSDPLFDVVPSGPPSPPDLTLPGTSHVVTTPLSAFIHGTGLLAADFRLMAQRQTSLIWSPRSNVSLYGLTADVVTADRLGVRTALSTDWILSGSMNLQRELACADHLNRNYYGAYFSAEQLWRMVTINAAAVTRSDDLLGTLAADRLADIAVFAAGPGESPYRAAINAEPAEVLLVLRGGRPLYGDAGLLDELRPQCATLEVCGRAKGLCTDDELGTTFAELSVQMSAQYPLFYCTLPADEPSCAPERYISVNGSTVYSGLASVEDPDGDGLAGTADNCPGVFNPVRPVDGGTQADGDEDGIGDPCDTAP